MSDNFRYGVFENILARHGKHLYHARVMDRAIVNGFEKYLIHYVGWNKNWDEMVGLDRLEDFDSALASKTSKKRPGFALGEYEDADDAGKTGLFLNIFLINTYKF